MTIKYLRILELNIGLANNFLFIKEYYAKLSLLKCFVHQKPISYIIVCSITLITCHNSKGRFVRFIALTLFARNYSLFYMVVLMIECTPEYTNCFLIWYGLILLMFMFQGEKLE